VEVQRGAVMTGLRAGKTSREMAQLNKTASNTGGLRKRKKIILIKKEELVDIKRKQFMLPSHA